MKSTLTVASFAVVTLFSAAVSAAPYVEARIAGSNTEIEDSTDKIEIDSTGFDLRAGGEITDQIGIRASYLQVDSDEATLNGTTADVDTELTIIRVGPTYNFTDVGQNAVFFGGAEFASVDFEVNGDGDSDTGFDVLLGLHDKAANKFLWNVELGYVSLEDKTGALFEFNVGYRFTPNLSAILGGQGYALENDDEGTDSTLSTGTLGLRYTF